MDIFNSFFDQASSRYNYNSAMEIMFRREEFEKNLDEMWAIYAKGNTRQLVEYNKQKEQIKSAGLKVLRNSAGKHKIVKGGN